MENKQTAVEWLEQEFIKLESTIGVYGVMYELLEQAKQMERKQIEEAADEYFKLSHSRLINSQQKEYERELFIAGVKWQQEDMIEKLEMHILINEHDWNRNPQAQFRDFIQQFKNK